MACSPPGSSVHGISQARILEWVAISYSRGSSWSRDQTLVSCCLPHWQADSLPLAPPGKPSLVRRREEKNIRNRRQLEAIEESCRGGHLLPGECSQRIRLRSWVLKNINAQSVLQNQRAQGRPSGCMQSWPQGAGGRELAFLLWQWKLLGEESCGQNAKQILQKDRPSCLSQEIL